MVFAKNWFSFSSEGFPRSYGNNLFPSSCDCWQNSVSYRPPDWGSKFLAGCRSEVSLSPLAPGSIQSTAHNTVASFFLYFIGVYLLYNAVLFFAVQWSESAISTYNPSLLDLPPTPSSCSTFLGHHRATSWAPCAILHSKIFWDPLPRIMKIKTKMNT